MQEQSANIREQYREIQENHREIRQAQQALTVLMLKIGESVGVRAATPAPSSSRVPSSAGDLLLASPIADLRGLSLHTPSAASSTSAMSGSGTFFTLSSSSKLIPFFKAVRARPVASAPATSPRESRPPSRASSKAKESAPLS